MQKDAGLAMVTWPWLCLPLARFPTSCHCSSSLLNRSISINRRWDKVGGAGNTHQCGGGRCVPR